MAVLLQVLQLGSMLVKGECLIGIDCESLWSEIHCSLSFPLLRCECNLRMTNIGKQLPVEKVNILLDSKLEQGKHLFLASG